MDIGSLGYPMTKAILTVCGLGSMLFAQADGATGGLLVALVNLGGVGMLAAALLLLHREALRRFSEELAAERKSSERLFTLVHHEGDARLLRAIEVMNANHRDAVARLEALHDDVGEIRDGKGCKHVGFGGK